MEPFLGKGRAFEFILAHIKYTVLSQGRLVFKYRLGKLTIKERERRDFGAILREWLIKL